MSSVFQVLLNPCHQLMFGVSSQYYALFHIYFLSFSRQALQANPYFYASSPPTKFTRSGHNIARCCIRRSYAAKKTRLRHKVS
mmetsp:Transcript_28266/g.60238  ORF Transcript_28266/g.60238 Transcript_28266/m.60238 type:complete len:83 (+) Transcript_28266:315-563(+)